MELPKKAAKLFADNAKLQKMAYNMMVEICHPTKYSTCLFTTIC